jgi:hypothetical protein
MACIRGVFVFVFIAVTYLVGLISYFLITRLLYLFTAASGMAMAVHCARNLRLVQGSGRPKSRATPNAIKLLCRSS